MNTYISLLSCIAVRKEPSEKSEMVTQILFGEEYNILEKGDKFSNVKLLYDNYAGWVSNEMITKLKHADSTGKYYVNASLFDRVIYKDKIIIVPGASSFYDINAETGKFSFNNEHYFFEDIFTESGDKNVFDLAHMHLHAPYLWGGRTFMGIDCSGLVQNVFKMKHIKIPRDASQQADYGKNINISDVSRGDVAFFKNNEEKIVHVGILDGEGKIIHSSGKVRIDDFDENGIFNTETLKLSHNLAFIRRIEKEVS